MLKILSPDEYRGAEYLNAMCVGGPGHGKSVSGLTLLDGAAGEATSEIVYLSVDVGGLDGVKLQAQQRKLGPRVKIVSLEDEAAGKGQTTGKLAFCDMLYGTILEIVTTAQKGHFGPLPTFWLASLTTAAESVLREVRAEYGDRDMMNPDKWNTINAIHSNLRCLIGQFPGHKILECHLERPPVGPAMGGAVPVREPSLDLTGKQASAYPRSCAQLMELVKEEGVPGGRAARRVFETRANSSWTRKVRMGDERLAEKEPADWSVICNKLRLRMVKDSSSTRSKKE